MRVDRVQPEPMPDGPGPISTGKDRPRLDQQQKRKSQSERPTPPALAFLLPARPNRHHRRPDQHLEGPRRPRRRPARSAARHALGVAAAATMTTPAPRTRSRSHRPPPAPGRTSHASAAPDDHASSRPPPTMTTHQRQPCPACTAPTACQPCQTSQQQRSRQRRPPGKTSPPAPHTCRRLHRCRLPDDPPRSAPQNGHFAPPPEGSDSPPNGIEL